MIATLTLSPIQHLLLIIGFFALIAILACAAGVAVAIVTAAEREDQP